MLHQQLLHVSNIYVYVCIQTHILLEVRDNIWFGCLRLSSAEHYGRNWLFTHEWTHWTHRTGLAIDIHVCDKRTQRMRLHPILKGLRGLGFKCLNRYKPLFATNKREKHTSSSTCGTPEASASIHGVAIAAGQEGCPPQPRFLLLWCGWQSRLVCCGVHSRVVNREGVSWTLQSGFQPQLGLSLQILLFVQPSCAYTNEWHLHGTVLQHQNWPTHSVPCH